MYKKILILGIIFLLAFPIAKALSCNEKCIKEGYTIGSCKLTCDTNKNEISIGRADDCYLFGEASLVIGTTNIQTYSNDDAYIGEDSKDPNWVWVINGLKTNAKTEISNTADASKHSGPVIGVRNDFIANDIDLFDVKAKTINGEYCLPEDYICVKYNSSTITASDYGTYQIEYTSIDLNNFDSSWASKPAILIRSYDKDDGLKTQRSGYTIANISADVTTDKIWVIYNSTGYIGIFYEDIANVKQLAGYIQMNNVDRNIADINYYNTQDSDIQIDLRGNITTADSVNITLDISGDEGVVKDTDGIDDLIIQLSHGANGNFDGLGQTPNTAEKGELIWGNSAYQIGEKDEDHLSLYGIKIINPKSNGASDQVILEIPKDQVKTKIIIKGKAIKTTKEREEILIIGEKAPSPILASELASLEAQHIMFVGGPCADPLVEEVEEFPKCNTWPYKPGEAIIQIAAVGDKVMLLVAGTTAKDTQRASIVLQNYENFKKDLKGKIVKVTRKIPEKESLEINNIKVEPLTRFTIKLDLSDFPVPFLEAGKFGNMLVVLGDKALAEDTIGASYILSKFMSITRKAAGLNETIANVTTVSHTITDEIPLGNDLADSGFFDDTLDDQDLVTLQDTKINFKGNDYNVRDVLMFYNDGPSMQTSLSSGDDNYGTDAYMELEQGRLRYYYAFDEKIDLTKVEEDQPVEIKFLNRYLKITDIINENKFKSQVAGEYIMKVGESITIEGQNVTLVDVSESGSVVIEVNSTRKIISSGDRKTIGNIEVKNLETFYETARNCCCFDLLSYLK